VDYALAAGTRRLALFHHDPLRDDAALDRLVEICRQRAAATDANLNVFAAAEGQVLDLAGKGDSAPRVPGSAATTTASPARVPAEAPTILIADDDPTVVRLLSLTLQPDGFRLSTASDGESALRLSRVERPALILLDWQMPASCATLCATPTARSWPSTGRGSGSRSTRPRSRHGPDRDDRSRGLLRRRWRDRFGCAMLVSTGLTNAARRRRRG